MKKNYISPKVIAQKSVKHCAICTSPGLSSSKATNGEVLSKDRFDEFSDEDDEDFGF